MHNKVYNTTGHKQQLYYIFCVSHYIMWLKLTRSTLLLGFKLCKHHLWSFWCHCVYIHGPLLFPSSHISGLRLKLRWSGNFHQIPLPLLVFFFLVRNFKPNAITSCVIMSEELLLFRRCIVQFGHVCFKYCDYEVSWRTWSDVEWVQ